MSHPFRILVGTYNCNQQPATKVALSNWIGEIHEHESLDLYIFSFQELTTVDNVSKNPKPLDLTNFGIWNTEVLHFINSQRKDSKVVPLWDGRLGGTMLASYVRESFKENIHNQYTMAVQCSLSKTTIKGAICIRFEIGHHSYSFASVHFTADQETENYEARIQDYHKVAKSQYNENEITFSDHDFVCWVGDVNFRVNLPQQEILKLVEEKKFNEILQHDQLNIARREGLAFTGYTEGSVNFPPTYKYTKGTHELSLSEPPDKRIPAYTDRVLYKHSERIDASLLGYTMGSLTESDHKPIAALFNIVPK